MEYIVVLVTSYFRYLASAPKVHWRARAEAPALEQEPELGFVGSLVAYEQGRGCGDPPGREQRGGNESVLHLGLHRRRLLAAAAARRRAGVQLSLSLILGLQQQLVLERLVVQSARAQQLLRVLAVALQRLGQYSHLDVARTFGCDVQCDASSAGLLGAVTSPWSPFIEGTP
jgi:hypothetical protein